MSNDQHPNSDSPNARPPSLRDHSIAVAGARQRRRGASRHSTQSAEEQMRILSLLRETIVLHDEALDDPDVMLIVAEGETTLFEALDIMVQADVDDDALIHGLKMARDTMAARLHRLEERKKSRRVVIEQALLLLDCKTLERPTATLVLSERAPTLLVEEEASIPTQYFDLKPTLNRRRAKEALESGEAVPGARLSLTSITLTVKRR